MRDIINIRLKAVYEFIAEHYKILLIFSVPIAFVYHLLFLLMGGPINILTFNLTALGQIFLGFLFIGTLMTVMIYIIDGLTNKRKIDVAELKHFTKQNIFIITISIFLVILLANIGFILLIIPGIIAFTRLASVPFLISLDKVKLFHSIDLSFEFSKNYTWPMFFCLLIITFIQFNVQAVLGFLQINLGGFVGTIINALVYIIEIILVYHFYLDIKRDMLATLDKQLPPAIE